MCVFTSQYEIEVGIVNS